MWNFEVLLNKHEQKTEAIEELSDRLCQLVDKSELLQAPDW